MNKTTVRSRLMAMRVASGEAITEVAPFIAYANGKTFWSSWASLLKPRGKKNPIGNPRGIKKYLRILKSKKRMLARIPAKKRTKTDATFILLNLILKILPIPAPTNN